MYFPVTQTYNFFKDPYEIIDYAKSLEYRHGGSNYPGSRTDDIWKFNSDLFQHISLKILSLFYPNSITKFSYEAEATFQKITYEDVELMNKNGWVHKDGSKMLSAIIYLTPNNNTTGTSIYMPKKPIGELHTHGIKSQYNENKNVDENEYVNELNKHNSKFKKVAEFYSEFNSMICFDSNLYHAANFNLKPGEERLTYITFFKKISAPWFPMVESNCVI